MVVWILLIVVGFILLIKGADFLVDGASNIAKKFHIPEIIIGLTVVSSNVKNYATVKLLKNHHLTIELPTNVNLQYLVGFLA